MIITRSDHGSGKWINFNKANLVNSFLHIIIECSLRRLFFMKIMQRILRPMNICASLRNFQYLAYLLLQLTLNDSW